ncbi:hypothetical protein COTS27_00244 [Spirochaetota bacterium]|nr:hypothetical protein COTS27_00244 [Spirochaetota bacterium]
MKLMTQSLLIFCGLLLIISCAPSTDTAPPDNATLLANLIKKSNPEISGLVVTADNSDPSSPKLNITGLTNKVLGEPATETITIDQSQGITTTPASFTVTAERLISPHKVTTPLTVTFEGEAAVSYTVTTKISGAPVNDWFASDNLNNYISASFAGQGGTFVIAESTLSVTGLTNSPTGAGEITFALPTGFTADASSIAFSNPDGTNAATSSPTPNKFTITETENIGNSMAYTIADVPLAALTRFTPGLHIKITEDSTSTDITSTLTITEKANNVIHIEGLTNKVGQNTYTLAIDEVAEFFTTPGNNPIMRMIIEPVVDISPGDGTITDGNNQGPTTISLTNNGETEAAMYSLEVMFSKSAPVSDWFTVDDFRKYITEASFAGVSTTEIRFNEMMIAVSGANDFANEPSETALFTTALPNGFELDTNALMSPAGDGFAAVTNAPIGMIAIFETGASTNRQEYPVTITLRAYISPLTGNITATYGGVPAAPSDITIETNKIVISGFTNNDTDTTESGTVMVADTVRAGYTITPPSLEIADPDGKVPINVELGTITVTNDRTRVEFSHPVTVEFASGTSVIQLRIEGTEILNSPLENVSSGATIGITTMACKLLTAPTVTRWCYEW